MARSQYLSLPPASCCPLPVRGGPLLAALQDGATGLFRKGAASAAHAEPRCPDWQAEELEERHFGDAAMPRLARGGAAAASAGRGRAMGSRLSRQRQPCRAWARDGCSSSISPSRRCREPTATPASLRAHLRGGMAAAAARHLVPSSPALTGRDRKSTRLNSSHPV